MVAKRRKTMNFTILKKGCVALAASDRASLDVVKSSAQVGELKKNIR
jgi:hypothetical protein